MTPWRGLVFRLLVTLCLLCGGTAEVLMLLPIPGVLILFMPLLPLALALPGLAFASTCLVLVAASRGGTVLGVACAAAGWLLNAFVAAQCLFPEELWLPLIL